MTMPTAATQYVIASITRPGGVLAAQHTVVTAADLTAVKASIIETYDGEACEGSEGEGEIYQIWTLEDYNDNQDNDTDHEPEEFEIQYIDPE